MFLSGKISIWNFDTFICFYQRSRYKIRNIWCHVKSRTWAWNSIGQLQAVSIISSRYLFIGRHTYHRCAYLLGLAFICTIFWRFIYFHRSVRTSFDILRVQVSFIFRFFFGLGKYTIYWSFESISEACIWLLNVLFSTLIFRVVLIEWIFLMALILSLLLK